MQFLSMLTWVTQLGISVIVPPIALLFLANWLQEKYGLGAWISVALFVLGLLVSFSTARSGIRTILKEGGLSLPKKNRKPDDDSLSTEETYFNDHN